MTSQRIVVCAASLEHLELYSVDVENAYLNGVVDTKLYMRQPQGFVDPNFPNTKTHVCELLKGLYGLKQAGNIWNAAIHAHIIEVGFTRTHADLCVYTKSDGSSRMIISLHVDDFLVASTPTQFKWFVSALEKKFKIKWREATICLGIKIEREPSSFSLN